MNKLSRYRKLRYNQLFESENRELRLNEMGNPLEMLSQYVDFEIFRPTLESALFTGERKSNAGRPPIDCVLMFKVLFLQRYYGLSDHQIEYQIVDRTSFRKFLGIECVDDVPDEKTVWKYRELLTNTGVYDKLFRNFIVSWKVRVCNSMRVASLMPVLLLPLANVTPVMKMSR